MPLSSSQNSNFWQHQTTNKYTFAREKVFMKSRLIDLQHKACLEKLFATPELIEQLNIFAIEELLTQEANSETKVTNSSKTNPITSNAQLQGNKRFQRGFFTVAETGQVSFEFLYDGGGYRGELGIFSLQDLPNTEVSSHQFILEAIKRVVSDSVRGHIVISECQHGERFSSNLGELTTWSKEEYPQQKTLSMKPGDQFAIVLIPHGTFSQVLECLQLGQVPLPEKLNPLFSLDTQDSANSLCLGQIADLVGNDTTYVFEDLRLNETKNKEYNDIIFRTKGAKGVAVPLDEFNQELLNQPGINHNFAAKLLSYLNLPIEPETGINYEPGELLVKFRADLSDRQIENLAYKYGALKVESLVPYELDETCSLKQWRILSLDIATNILKIRRRLEREAAVEATELNIVSYSTRSLIMSSLAMGGI